MSDREWEPGYGFCDTNVTSNEELARALEAARREVCAYGSMGEQTCDCKYGVTPAHPLERRRGERTGCPELREMIHRLLYRPESFMSPKTATR